MGWPFGKRASEARKAKKAARNARDNHPNNKLFKAVSRLDISEVREAFAAGADANAIKGGMKPLDIVADELVSSLGTRVHKGWFNQPQQTNLNSLSEIWNELVDHNGGLQKHRDDPTFKQDNYYRSTYSKSSLLGNSSNVSGANFKAPRQGGYTPSGYDYAPPDFSPDYSQGTHVLPGYTPPDFSPDYSQASDSALETGYTAPQPSNPTLDALHLYEALSPPANKKGKRRKLGR